MFAGIARSIVQNSALGWIQAITSVPATCPVLSVRRLKANSTPLERFSHCLASQARTGMRDRPVMSLREAVRENRERVAVEQHIRFSDMR